MESLFVLTMMGPRSWWVLDFGEADVSDNLPLRRTGRESGKDRGPPDRLITSRP